MDKRIVFVLGIVLLVFVLLCTLRYLSKPKEGFAGYYDAMATNRDAYIKNSKSKYNRFSDTMDITKGNFIHNDDPAAIAAASGVMQQAMVTSDINVSDVASTLMGIDILPTDSEIAQPNMLLQDVKKCEALRKRSSCAKLSDPYYSNCGICVKGGTPYSYENQNKHIGGLLLLPEDRAIQEAEGYAGNAVYQPTIGDCPEGSFFVDQAACEKEVNRVDCKEAGLSGGFKGGRTIEGNDVVAKKCAQVPVAGEDVFIYDPKNRTFNVNLRAITPTGTGICRIWVYDTKNNMLGFGENSLPGSEFVINVKNVKEGATVNVVVAMETAYRAKGKSEVFQISDGYNETQQSAAEVCRRFGAMIANKAQIEDALAKGAQVCSFGWGADFFGFPMQSYESRGYCGKANSINQWNEGKSGAAWCYGIKPPQTTIGEKIFKKAALPWFNSLGSAGNPSQESLPNLWSQYSADGEDYEARSDRAIILQWEMSSGSSVRTVSFQPTIVAVNGNGPSFTSADGSRTFRVLRQFGTFVKSQEIYSPRPTASTKMLKNQFWFWSNQGRSQTAKFTAQIPGTFLDSFYPEDVVTARNGPLITDINTQSLLRTSPCLKEGQTPGKYSMDCLQNLFVSSGGDIVNGKMVTTNGGLIQLNQKGDMEAIESYLTDLYDIATTGKDSDGKKVGSNSKEHASIINSAAQLLFGYDIATPCEDISEDSAGNIVLTPKKTPLDVDCLNWLWKNTGTDLSRGDGDGGRHIKNTFTSIYERYSGLRNSESVQSRREQYPFRTCQPNGSMAPVTATGASNREAINMANTRGSVQAVQDWYNKIYQDANAEADDSRSLIQKDAVKQCYGIEKSKNVISKFVVTTKEGFVGSQEEDEDFVGSQQEEGFVGSQGQEEDVEEGFWGTGTYAKLDKQVPSWADGDNVGGGLRSAMKSGTKVVMRMNSMPVIRGIWKTTDEIIPDNWLYLRYNPTERVAQLVHDKNDANCVFTLIFPDDDKQFRDWTQKLGFNGGMTPRRFYFALQNAEGNYLTQPGDHGYPCVFKPGEWGGKPGPNQFWGWNEAQYANHPFPFGPFSVAGWGPGGAGDRSDGAKVYNNPADATWTEYIKNGGDPKKFVFNLCIYSNGPSRYLLELQEVVTTGVTTVTLD